MITVQYKRIGNSPRKLDEAPTHTRTFDGENAEADFQEFAEQDSTFVVSVERSGSHAASRLNSIFGGGQ